LISTEQLTRSQLLENARRTTCYCPVGKKWNC